MSKEKINQNSIDSNNTDKIEIIDISKISNFPNNPFKVIDDERMLDIVKSVKEYGVIIPVIVRPKQNGTFELISGHRRKRACELAGIEQIKCIVKELTDDEATILMVDSNIQREEILPSEKAFAYKMKLEALKHQGKRVDLEENLTSDPVGLKLQSIEIIGNDGGDSQTQVKRYIRLTKLIPELLEQVDLKRIAFRPAVELSYLDETNQYAVLDKLEYDDVSPSLSQAILLKKMQQDGTITETKIEEILDREKPNQKEFIKIHNEKIDKYLPTKVKEKGNIEEFIIECVQEHNKREKAKNERNSR